MRERRRSLTTATIANSSQCNSPKWSIVVKKIDVLTVGAAQTAIHLWIQDQTKGTELAVKRFRKNIENLEKPEDKYELCREMERLCVLRSEVNEVQVAIVLEEVKKSTTWRNGPKRMEICGLQ